MVGVVGEVLQKVLMLSTSSSMREKVLVIGS